jgi:glycosyltransferase involved in cell wall biosynthesis
VRILLANEARQGGGGVETYLASLVPHLEARGHGVALLYANPSSEPGPTRIVANETWSVADEGIDRALDAARAWRPDVCFSHNMRRLDIDARVAAAWPTFKMMHGYFGTCLSGHKAFAIPAVKPCTRRCGAGCLVHYLPRRCGQLRPIVMVEQFGWARRQQQLFHEYAGVVVASDHMRREYLRYALPPDRIHTIPLFSTPPASPAADRGPSIDVLFLGRMTPLKGAATLVRAVDCAARAIGRPLKAVFAGEGPELQRLRQLARELGDDGAFTVEFPGWVREPARAALLARTSLVAIPSLWPEPFGLVGLEAAQFGVPAVAFGVGGIAEWLTDGVNGRLVDVRGGAPALGAAIASVLGDVATRARLASGAQRVAARFTADAHIAKLEQVFGLHREPGSPA